MVMALAVLAAVVGATFVLQGLGVPIGRSFMIGDLRWTAIGVVMVAIAGVIVLATGRATRS
jgi:cytochrome c oxidase subunit IV